MIPGSFAEANFLLTAPALHTLTPKHTNQPFIHPTTASQSKSPLSNSGVISEEPGGQASSSVADSSIRIMMSHCVAL